jgi:hypothetical protein
MQRLSCASLAQARPRAERRPRGAYPAWACCAVPASCRRTRAATCLHRQHSFGGRCVVAHSARMALPWTQPALYLNAGHGKSLRLGALVSESWEVPGQMPEFRQRVDVLRRLGCVADDNTVQLKVPPRERPGCNAWQCMAGPDAWGTAPRFSMQCPVSAVRHVLKVRKVCFWSGTDWPKRHRLSSSNLPSMDCDACASASGRCECARAGHASACMRDHVAARAAAAAR